MPKYGYNYMNCEKHHEYNGYLRDILRNDEELLKRAQKQVNENAQYLKNQIVEEYHNIWITFKPEERMDDNNCAKIIVDKQRDLIDQVDGFVNLINNIIIEVNGNYQNRSIEEAIITPDLFKEILYLMNNPHVADILSKESTIYRDVARSFINDHPKLLEDVHNMLKVRIDEIEKIIGPLEKAVHFSPKDTLDHQGAILKE